MVSAFMPKPSNPGLPAADPRGSRGHDAKRERLVWGVFAGLLLVSLLFLVHPWYEPVRDASIYMSTARSLLAGEGYAYLGIPFTSRPPGFPLLLLPVLAASGMSFAVLNGYVALLGALAALLFALHWRPRLGLALALATAAALWLNPGFRRLSNEILSDVPGLAALFACLLVERWASRAPSVKRELLLGLAIGLASYVRSILILLLPAIVLARWASGRGGARRPWGLERGQLGQLFALALAVVSLWMPWALRNRAVAPPPPVDQFAVYDYSTAMWRRDGGDPSSPRFTAAEILQRVPERASAIAAALGGRLGDGIPVEDERNRAATGSEIAVAAVLLAGLLHAIVRHRGPAELFAAASLGVALVYFDFRTRLMLPVFAIALAATVEMTRHVARRLSTERRATALTAAAVLVVGLLDFAPRRDWREIEARHRGLLARAGAIARAVPAGARLGTAFGFHDTVYLGRPVYSLALAVRRAGTPAAVEAVVDRYRLDTLYFSANERVDRRILDDLRGRYPEPLAIADQLYVVKVREPAP
jgi:4-amino-4-deoxy-L-arabinose transferase-like glycosyltransferase